MVAGTTDTETTPTRHVFRPPPRLVVPVDAAEDVDESLLASMHRQVADGGIVQVNTSFRTVEELPVQLRNLTLTNNGQANEALLRQLLVQRPTNHGSVDGDRDRDSLRPRIATAEVDWTKVGLAAAITVGAAATVGTGAMIGAYCGGPAGAFVGAAVGVTAAATGVGIASASVGRKLILKVGHGGIEIIINDNSASDVEQNRQSQVCSLQ
eukprot:TRINITY_DN32618_c0_g1_i1.p1 TRINITY_DN32618_c0_g1~~TRINITY_DN32618_c0_g1_i1.p1  ORF type:complete len:232 (+),score=42.96 TRINITY_DN32618_c0_g1_i1:67-696(+)